jgi:archaellum biogenesis protein FlaJ (TadC family)
MSREDLSNYLGEFGSNLKDLNHKMILAIKDQYSTFYKEYFAVYEESGILLMFPEYNRKVMIYSGIFSLLVFILTVYIHDIFYNFAAARILYVSGLVGIVTFAFSLILGLLNPIYKRSQAKAHLETNLVYSLSYMAVLASSGMPIERIIETVAEVEDNPPLTRLTRKFLTNIKLLGVDVHTALREIADKSPSRSLSRKLEAIRTTVMTSGDLKGLLSYEVERQLAKKKEKLRNTLTTLVYVGEMYVTLMVVTPVLFILMITIMSLMASSSFGAASALQLNLIVFFGIPVMATAFIIFLDIILGGEE